jgi:Zn-dependent protease
MILQLLFSEPVLFLIWLVAIVYAITIHEFSHAAAGHLEGDATAESMGRLTLNPIAHIDPLGFLAMLFVGFGWGKPVPFNPFRLKHARFGPALVSLAGPASNIISLIVFGLAHKALTMSHALPSENLLMIFLETLMYINAILAIFNLIPLPPLDGSKLLFAILPQSRRNLLMQMFLERYGALMLIFFILVDNFSSPSVLGTFFRWITGFVFRVFS